MKPFPQLDPTAEETASLWAARLDGSTLSATDRLALDEWLAAHPDHRSLLSTYCQFSADLEQQLPKLGTELDVAAGVGRPGRSWKTWSGVALAAAAAVALLLNFVTPQSQSESIATAIGQRQAHVLADGSRVELNTQTALAIEVNQTERRVRLASGQAFFSVAHDTSRPFIVETPSGSIRVTGTKFDVRAETASPIEVLVVEGSVEMRAGGVAGGSGTVNLSAGRRYTGGDKPTVETLSARAVQEALAWRQGRIVFNNVPLREALARFGRYHGRGLAASAEAGDFAVGGNYSLDDLDGFLAAMEEIFPVQVNETLSGTVHVRLRNEP